jgi:hypothetical protein
MRTETVVSLLNGVSRGEGRHCEAAVRELTGADEILLLESGEFRFPAERATLLLSAAVVAIGTIRPVPAELVRELTIGDRERLIFALYAMTFGPQLDAIARCGRSGCGELIEVPVDLREVLRAGPQAGSSGEHALTASAGCGSVHVRFRLPNGRDHEVAAALASTDDVSAAADAILSRCVIAISDERGSPVLLHAVREFVRSPLEDAFRTLDLHAETVAQIECPACGHPDVVCLDAFTLLETQLARSSVAIEVDRLARVYGWSEAGILAMPVARRRRYLALAHSRPSI